MGAGDGPENDKGETPGVDGAAGVDGLCKSLEDRSCDRRVLVTGGREEKLAGGKDAVVCNYRFLGKC